MFFFFTWLSRFSGRHGGVAGPGVALPVLCLCRHLLCSCCSARPSAKGSVLQMQMHVGFQPVPTHWVLEGGGALPSSASAPADHCSWRTSKGHMLQSSGPKGTFVCCSDGVRGFWRSRRARKVCGWVTRILFRLDIRQEGFPEGLGGDLTESC